MQIEQIKTVLADRLTSFRDQNPEKHSFAYISMRTEVNPKFVERAMKNQLGADIDSKKVLDLAKLVCDPKETQDIAEFFAGRLLGESSILKDAIFAKLLRDSGLIDASEDIDEALKTENAYVVYCLCANSNGATENEIRSILGGTGIDALNTLLLKGIIHLKEGFYKTRSENYTYSFEHFQRVFQVLSRFYKPQNVGKERNYAHVVTSTLNRDGIKKWQAEHKRHHDALREIRDSHQGEIDVFSVGFMDTFTSEDIDSKNYVKSKKDIFMNGASKTLMSILLFVLSMTFVQESQALELKPKYKELLKNELSLESDVDFLHENEVVFELKGQTKQTIKNEFDFLVNKRDQEVIRINEIDIIRALEGKGKLELDSGVTIDGREFNFRDYSPVKRVLVGGGDAGGG